MPKANRQFVIDRELVEILGNIPGVGVPFLRADRVGKQLIPFHRVGRSCLYDPTEAIDAIRALRVGGKRPAPTKAAA